MHGSIAPSFVEETTSMVERGEEVDVGVGAEPVKVADLEVGPEVAVVVGLTAVVTKELHAVVLDNVLGVVLGEVLGGVPEGRNGLDVFVKTEGEAVLLLVVGHELEGVVVDVAVELDAGLDAPVPLVVEHQGMAEEEARLVAAHVSVADGVAVDDLLLLHRFADLGGLVLVNPFGEGPVLFGNLAVLGLAGHKSRCNLLELVVELVVVEENPVVVELAVEAVFDLADGLGDFPDIGVAGEGDEGCVHAVAGGSRGGEALLLVGRSARRDLLDFIVGDGGVALGRSGRRFVVLVDWPACGRHRRRGADEVEEDEGLGMVSRCFRNRHTVPARTTTAKTR